MNYMVLYSPEAEQDLIEILAYGIERWGEQLAEEMCVKVTEQLENLYFFALSYQTRIFNTREKLILDTPYRAIILIDENKKQVFILRILHTSKQIDERYK
ncbi:hypothetical protein GCM10023206_24530 [Acinetobacter puyangensis]|uniref:Plasmid stabilization system protein ParE n=1 Tax=Acinetobacter puyangensis TaxID=1096779 RepID=A0A240E6D9_9GAMM|nr:type II toxin-antitoxin system RelE/ParE family toxin [Acinetobacter puyangensis]SNX43779.1 Plasmid stabilization system protein ParE [Acinetobacter puyangensis]